MFRAEEKSEALQTVQKIYKFDMRIRLALPHSKEAEPKVTFERLFLEWSHGEANSFEVYLRWKLVRIGKDAHDFIHRTIKNILRDQRPFPYSIQLFVFFNTFNIRLTS